MPHMIHVRLNVLVDKGPQAAATRVLELDAYDQVNVSIPNDGNPHDVQVQPDDGSRLRLLVLTATHYDPPLSWEADASGTTRQLDQPLLVAGESVASLLGGPGNTIVFTNGGGEEIRVQILVGRDAVG
jgi:hypothetical protein